ncbi:MAG: hypothetical protein JW789_00480 [Candidatus Aenigmarchaeota archaeon]|nr:hypothetical protein [Candidatus Aenigmarchaeota archaeon]
MFTSSGEFSEKRGYIHDFILSYSDANSSSGRKFWDVMTTLRDGRVPENEIGPIMDSGLLLPAEYRAIADGYSGTGVNEGNTSDRRRIAGKAREMYRISSKLMEMEQHKQFSEETMKREKAERDGINLAYRFDMNTADEIYDNKGEDAFRDYMMGSSAHTFLDAMWRMAVKTKDPDERNIRLNEIRLMSYLKGNNVDRIAITKDIFDSFETLSSEELLAIKETGLCDYNDRLSEAFNKAFEKKVGVEENVFEEAMKSF